MAKFSLGIGEKLLSDVSREMDTTGEWEFERIPLELIDVSPFSEDDDLTNIADIKESILEVGLEQNLVVCRAKDDRYRLITGLRRYTALSELVTEGHEEYKLVPCKIKQLEKMDLPLSDESKEKLAFVTTNVQVRDQSDAFRLRMLHMLSDVYDELKTNGYGKLGKRREWVAEQLSVSSATIGIYEYVDRHLAEPFKEQLADGTLPLTAAREIARMEPKEQEKLFQKKGTEESVLSVSDVQDFAEKSARKKEKKKNIESLEYSTYIIDAKNLSYLSALDDLLGMLQREPITIPKKDMAKLLNAQQAIEKQQKIIRTVLEKHNAGRES